MKKSLALLLSLAMVLSGISFGFAEETLPPEEPAAPSESLEEAMAPDESPEEPESTDTPTSEPEASEEPDPIETPQETAIPYSLVFVFENPEEEFLAMTVGEKATPEIIVTPEGAEILWASGDEAIALTSVGGEIEAIAVGEVTITATLPDGSEAELTVLVTEPPAPEDTETPAAEATETSTPVTLTEVETPEAPESAEIPLYNEPLVRDQLPQVTGLHWEDRMMAWTPIPNTHGYRLVLYKDGVEFFRDEIDGNDYDDRWPDDSQYFGSSTLILEEGAYYFTITALGDLKYIDSPPAESPVYHHVVSSDTMPVPYNLRLEKVGTSYDAKWDIATDDYGVTVTLFRDGEAVAIRSGGSIPGLPGHFEPYRFNSINGITEPGDYYFTLLVEPKGGKSQSFAQSPTIRIEEIYDLFATVFEEVYHGIDADLYTIPQGLDKLRQGSGLIPVSLLRTAAKDPAKRAKLVELEQLIIRKAGKGLQINITGQPAAFLSPGDIAVSGAFLSEFDAYDSVVLSLGDTSAVNYLDDQVYQTIFGTTFSLNTKLGGYSIPLELSFTLPASTHFEYLEIYRTTNIPTHFVKIPYTQSGNTVTFTLDYNNLTLFFVEKKPAVSSEVDKFVRRLYEIGLGRNPDSGWQTWLDGLLQGSETGASAIRGFFLSAEFIAQGVSNRDFVRLVYLTCMDREPDEPAFSNWVAYLDQGIGRAAVLNEFIKSLEYGLICENYGITRGQMPLDPEDQDILVTQFVQRLYTIILNRQPEQSGVRHWTNYLLNQSGNGKTTAYEFAFSPEFLMAGLSDTEFVTRMYRALLNREPEPTGMQDWLNEIALNGREGIFNGFADSPEFAQVMASYGVR